jgi:hypothetical protein
MEWRQLSGAGDLQKGVEGQSGSGTSFLPVGSYRARRPAAGMEADGDGKLAPRPAGHAGGREADGIGATRQADRQFSRLHAEGAAAPDGGHRFSLR